MTLAFQILNAELQGKQNVVGSPMKASPSDTYSTSSSLWNTNNNQSVYPIHYLSFAYPTQESSTRLRCNQLHFIVMVPFRHYK